MVLLSQVLLWVGLGVAESLSRPAGMAPPPSVELYLTENWQRVDGQVPISVALNDDPLYDYKDPDAALGTPARKGVFESAFQIVDGARNLGIFFASTYGIKEVRLNGQLLKAQSPTDPQGSLSGFGPAAYVLPDEFLRYPTNELVILSSGKTYKALPAYYVGAADSVLAAQSWGHFFAFDLVVAATAMMLFMALLCSVMAWSGEEQARVRALVILLVTWSLRNFAILGIYDALPLPMMRIATYASNYLPLVAFVFFALAWTGYGSRWLRFRAFSLLLCVVVPVLLILLDLRRLPILGGISVPWILDNALTLAATAATIWLFARDSARQSGWRWVEALLFIVCASALLVDKLDNMLHLSVPFTDLYLTFYFAPLCGLLFALGMCASIAAQTSRSRLAEQTLNSRLAQRLAASEAQIREQARRHAMLAERRRIMRDMHDGLGGRLTALAAEIGDADVSRAVLTRRVQDSMTELRLIVDSLDTEGDSLEVALGSFRVRIEPALNAAGIVLDWQISDVDCPPLSAASVLEIFRILQIACANVIQHSRASVVSIRLWVDEALVLEVVDDGVGFAVDAQEHNGIRNMRARAARLGGVLEIETDRTGTRVRLRLRSNRDV